MMALRRWLDENDAACEALEVDFTHLYDGADFREAMWGGPGVRWAPRRLMAHVNGLAGLSESLYRKVLLGQKGTADPVPRLLAALINDVRRMAFNQVSMWSPESLERGSEPEMIELPDLKPGLLGDEEDNTEQQAQEGERPFASALEIANWLSRRR